MIRKLFALTLFLLAIVSSSYSQAQERPKVGLVLSGGGAKGVAHIGIIKAMEEAGLYPDYITGTSMGSIIGGLYAIGYTADDIDSIARNMDWTKLLTNEIPLNQVAYEEKLYYGRYIMEFPFRNKKLGLPKGLIEGQALTIQMSNMTRPAHQIDDFNEFPIPFACIGANIVTGTGDVLDSGLLPEALRASMAIPTFFTPMEIDSILYVDGGLIRNFPVQEVIDMGADIIIGVSVSGGLEPKEKMNSMISVLSQAAFVASVHDTERQMKLVDIMIEPDLLGYSTASFSDTDKIIELGNKAGEAYLPVFKKLADSLLQFGPMHPAKRPVNPPTYKFSRIEITGNVRVPDELIIGKLRVEPDKEFTISELEDRIALLYGTLYFEKIVYVINPITSTLTIKVIESPRASLKMAVHYDTENKAGVNANFTMRNILFPSSRFIVEYDLAQNPIASLSYFKYLGKKQNVAIILDGDWVETILPSYWDEVTESKDETVVSGLLKASYLQGGLVFQGTYASNQTIKAGAHFFNNKIKPSVLDSIILSTVIGPEAVAFKKLNNKALNLFVFYGINTLDKQFFPKMGISLGVRLNYIVDRTVAFQFDSNDLGELTGDFNPDEIWKADFYVKYYHPLNPKLSLYTGLNILVSNGTDNLEDMAHTTFIGGYRPVALHAQHYTGAADKRFNNLNYFYLNLGIQWELISNMFLNITAEYIDSEYPMKWIYSNAVRNDFGAYKRRMGFSGMISYRSIIGPISIGVAKDQYFSGVNGFFSLGYYINRQ